MRTVRRQVTIAAVAATVFMMLPGCASRGLAWPPVSKQAGMPPTSPTPTIPPPASVPVSRVFPAGKGVPIGLYEPGFPKQTADLSAFSAATSVKPRMLIYFSDGKTPFSTSFADFAHANGAVPLVQLEPAGIPLTDIISGPHDGYLSQFAAAVRAYRYPVILCFGHEMNGDWYSWGNTNSTPAQYIAAWRHVVTVFRRAGATNAKWLWAVNQVGKGATSATAVTSVAEWWPGQQWVDLVGIDAYYYTASDTFSTVFGPTIDEIRQFTSSPLLIAEVAVGTTPDRESQIGDLLSGAEAAHAVGLVWFDEAQNAGLYHQDWHLEDDPTAANAFGAAVASS